MGPLPESMPPERLKRITEHVLAGLPPFGSDENFIQCECGHVRMEHRPGDFIYCQCQHNKCDCMKFEPKTSAALTPEEKKAVQEFYEERKRQFDAEPVRGLRPSPSVGWQCPNCGGAHAPDVSSCPEPPKGGSLRERLKRD